MNVSVVSVLLLLYWYKYFYANQDWMAGKYVVLFEQENDNS